MTEKIMFEATSRDSKNSADVSVMWSSRWTESSQALRLLGAGPLQCTL